MARTGKPVATPILNALIASGVIKVTDQGDYVGYASDGADVLIGNNWRPDAAERYLQDFPTPDMW